MQPTLLNTTNFPTPFCKTHLKSKQLLSRVCLDTDCPSYNLICFLCVNQSHKDHHTVSLAQFAQTLENCKYDQSLRQLVNQKKQLIKNQKTSYLSKMQKIRQTIVRILQKAQSTTLSYFQELERKLDTAEIMYMDLLGSLEIYSQGQFFSQIQDYIKKFKTFKNRQSEIFESIQINPQQIGNIENKQNEIIKFMEQVFGCKSLNIRIKPKIKELKQQKLKFVNYEVQWSQLEFKHPNIEIRGMSAVIENNKVSAYLSVLSSNLLDNKKVTCWTIQADKIKWGMMLGIAQQSVVLSRKFQYKGWGNFGEGHYMVCSRGEAFSGTDSKIRDQKQKYAFVDGDKLQFKYDPLQKLLIIRKNGQQFCEFSLQKPESSNYRVCAYLRDRESCASIIENE